MPYIISCPAGTVLNSPDLASSMACRDDEFNYYSFTLLPFDPSTKADVGSTDSGSVSPDPVTSFVDGHILGWGVVLAMVAAWSIHVLRRAI